MHIKTADQSFFVFKMNNTTINSHSIACWHREVFGMIKIIATSRTKIWFSIGLVRALTIAWCLISLISLVSCNNRVADIEMPNWDDAYIDSLIKKPNLKVLDIGNSYTVDATSLISTVVKSSGVNLDDLCFYELVRGGASFLDWCNIYSDSDDKSYSLEHVVGGKKVAVSNKNGKARDGSLFREVLSEFDWDIIFIHQVSTYAPYYEQWDGYGEGGYLNVLLSIIKQYQPNALIGTLLVHSYSDDYFRNKEHSSYNRWQKIVDSTRKLRDDYGISLIIPYGTAIENLRSSSLNDEYDLTRDGFHLGYGLSRYTAACCYYESLIARRTGVSCFGTPAQIDVSDKESKYPGINVTESNALIAQKAAVMAVRDMFHCYNPENEFDAQ